MVDEITEVWRSVDGFNGVFEISNLGRLKRVVNSKNMPDNNILKGEITKHGYRQYHMKVNNVSKKEKAHRLVAKAFLENKDNLPHVNHKDGNKLNNRVDNLEWCDPAYNNRHALETGLRKIDMVQVRNMHKTMAEKQKKRVGQYSLDGQLIREYESLKDTEEYFANSTNIGCVCRGIRKTAYGYLWKYI